MNARVEDLRQDFARFRPELPVFIASGQGNAVPAGFAYLGYWDGTTWSDDKYDSVNDAPGLVTAVCIFPAERTA